MNGYAQLVQEYFSFNGNTYAPWPRTGGKDAPDPTYGNYSAFYEASGPVFACILARLALFTEARFQFQQLAKGRPGNLFSLPQLDLLHEPWPGGTTADLLGRMEVDASLAGNAYVVDRGNSLEVLRPDWVSTVAVSGEGDLTPTLVGYRYYLDGPDRPEKFELLRASEVAHFAPIPSAGADRHLGMSWLTPIIREIQADQKTTAHKDAFLSNAATPNMIIKHDIAKDLDQVKAFKVLFDEEHAGYRNAWKTLHLGGGADATVVGANFKELEFKATQGAGETRIAAASGVPAIIAGFSEGLASATYSNYGMARRKFADHWARPQWRAAAGCLAKLVNVPSDARLWYDDRDISFLQEDAKDDAEIASLRAQTIKALVEAGYEPDAVIDAVNADDFSRLDKKHTGLFSVQLQAPGTDQGIPT